MAGALIAAGYLNNAVWTLKIDREGSGLRISDHPTQRPMIQSRHGSFRPMDVKLGPDGALYVADWYNPVIGHYQASLRHPDRDKTHGRIWRISAKGRPLLKPPRIAGATISELLELICSSNRWEREQAKRVLFFRKTVDVIPDLKRWCERLEAGAKDVDFARLQALGIFEAHEVVDATLLRQAIEARAPELRAYGAHTIARWHDRLSDFDINSQLTRLASDPDSSVRLAAIVAAGNIPRPESIDVVLTGASQPRDPFIDVALHAAVAVLKPLWQPAVAAGGEHWTAARRALLKEFDKPRAVAVKKSAPQLTGEPIVPVYGRLRFTSYLRGVMSADILTRGDPVRGAEIFRRPDLACLSCHQVGGEGGKLGPPLDSVGSAIPVEVLIGMVIEPQRELKEGYETFRITMKDGRVVIGIAVAGNAAEIVLRDPEGVEHTLAESEIAKREMIGSLMPAGLTDHLKPDELRDLFAYLTMLGKMP